MYNNKLNTKLIFILSTLKDILKSDNLTFFSISFNIGIYSIDVKCYENDPSIELWKSIVEDGRTGSSKEYSFKSTLELFNFLKTLKE